MVKQELRKIKEELTKLTKKEEQINFLIKQINNIKNKKLKQELEKILSELISEEDLEERITIPTPKIDLPQSKPLQQENLSSKLPEDQKTEETEELSNTIKYTRIIPNYAAESRELTKQMIIYNPLKKEDILEKLNLSSAEIRNYFVNEEDTRTYLTHTRSDEIVDIELTSLKDIEKPELDPLKKKKHISIKYELT